MYFNVIELFFMSCGAVKCFTSIFRQFLGMFTMSPNIPNLDAFNKGYLSLYSLNFFPYIMCHGVSDLIGRRKSMHI